MNIVTRDITSPFGVLRAYLLNAERFSNKVEAFGVIPTGIECLPNHRPGFRLELCSSKREYEILLDRDRVRLSMSTPNTPKQHLAQGGAASESTWNRFARILQTWEEPLVCRREE